MAIMRLRSLSPPAPERIRSAWIIAITADVLQLAIVPAFAPGFASPVNNALDVAVAILMTLFLRWHWAFLPTFVAELIPFFDLVPSWTLACFFATRGKQVGPPSAGAPPAPPTTPARLS